MANENLYGVSDAELAALKTKTGSHDVDIAALKTENQTLHTKVGSQDTEIAALKTENQTLHTKVDGLMYSMEFLVKKYNELEQRYPNSVATGGSSSAVLPIVSNQSGSSTTSVSATPATIENLEDKFATLPTDRLAAEMWRSVMENLPESTGPAAFDLLERDLIKFGQFITSVSSKQNFCDAVKNTCCERGFSKGIARKMQKLANNITVREDS